jgi:hypothetical protein
MPNENVLETAKCPWCGEKREIVPHASKHGREAAYCDCRGEPYPFMERPVLKPQAVYKPKESA